VRGLNNVWYGSYKFCANLTRFSKGQRKDHSEEDRVVKKPALEVQNRLSHNRTYAEVVRLQVSCFYSWYKLIQNVINGRKLIFKNG
jgi:hypothetical protein